MESAYSLLGFVNLTIPIPAWQMVIYIGLVGIFMLLHEVRGCLLTTYVFALYWGYYLFGDQFMAAASSNPGMMTAYISFGLLLTGFSLKALFYEK